MKHIIKIGLGTSAGIVAGKIIFGLSKEYCGGGFVTNVGTAALTIAVFFCGYSCTTGMLDGAFSLMDKEDEEDGEDG